MSFEVRSVPSNTRDSISRLGPRLVDTLAQNENVQIAAFVAFAVLGTALSIWLGPKIRYSLFGEE
jgi:hypothetical protein